VIATDRIEVLDDRAVAAAIAEVIDAMEADLDLVVGSMEDCLVALIQSANGVSPRALREALRRAVSAVVRDTLARLCSQVELPMLPPDMSELARVCASSRCELVERPDPWLVGLEAFWDRFEVVAERTVVDTTLRWEVIKAARARLRNHLARVRALFRSACLYDELARSNEVDGDSRLRAVLGALGGERSEPSELGYDLAWHHVAVVADASPSLDALARCTTRHLLRVQAPDGGMWAWLGGPDKVPEGDLDGLIAALGSSDASVAFGEPAEGIAGFAVSHRQALEAGVIAVASKRAVRFADCRLLIAVLRDGDLAYEFVERELGELNHPIEPMRELRDTLRAYLEHGQRVAPTAAVVRRDRKTVEKHLRRAEQLLHHPVGERTDSVLIALRVGEILRHGH